MESGSNRIASFLDDLEVSAEIKTTLFMIGYCLLRVQAVESSLTSVLTDSFPLQDIDSEDKAHRKKTLGALIKTLRERVNIDDDLEDLFVTFVESRNLFTHHLAKRFDLHTREGLIETANFCQILAIQAQELEKFLSAAILAANPGATGDDEEVLNLLPIIEFYFNRK